MEAITRYVFNDVTAIGNNYFSLPKNKGPKQYDKEDSGDHSKDKDFEFPDSDEEEEEREDEDGVDDEGYDGEAEY